MTEEQRYIYLYTEGEKLADILQFIIDLALEYHPNPKGNIALEKAFFLDGLRDNLIID